MRSALEPYSPVVHTGFTHNTAAKHWKQHTLITLTKCQEVTHIERVGYPVCRLQSNVRGHIRVLVLLAHHHCICYLEGIHLEAAAKYMERFGLGQGNRNTVQYSLPLFYPCVVCGLHIVAYT